METQEKNIALRLETVKAIHDQTAKLLPIIEQLNKVWNIPIIAMCGVLVQNLAFNGSDCKGYSLEMDITRIKEVHKAIKLLKNNSFNDTFIDWLWLEVDCIVEGNFMSEGF